MLIPKDNKYRLIDKLIDFSFIYAELKDKYCLDNGRKAADPIMLFKYLMIKVIDNFSDVDAVEHSRYDLSYKCFLGLMHEGDVIAPSLQIKFRHQRLKDVSLLDLLISKTVGAAHTLFQDLIQYLLLMFSSSGQDIAYWNQRLGQ